MSGPDETNYDPSLPARIRGELGGEEPSEAPEPPVEPPPVRPLVTAAKVLGGVVLGAVLAALTLSKGWMRFGGDASPRGTALGESRRHLLDRQWAKASEDLEELRQGSSLGTEGRLLDDTARGMLRLEEAEHKGDWVSAYDTALDLDRLWKESGALKLEISRRLDRARTEVMAGKKLAEGRDHLGAGELPEALAAFHEVPAGTACAEAAAAEAEKARVALKEKAFSEASQAADQGRWEEAQKALDALGESRVKDERLDALAQRIASGRAQQEALSRAEALLAALRVEEAKAALAQVAPDGPCAAARAALSDRLAQAEGAARCVAEARDRFDHGQGEAALSLLAKAGADGVPSDLRQGISRTLAAYQCVLEAEDRGDDLAALEGVRRITAMPLSPGNWYRARAEAAREPLERKVKALAEKAVAEGVAAFKDRKYRQAKAAFDKALKAVPEHPVAAVYQRRFLEVGRGLYQDGYVLRSIDPAAARARFEEALACLPEDDPTAAKARDALK